MTEATRSGASETREPAEIERDIAETRRAIDSTVEELGERLAPSQLVDDAKTYVKESAVRGVNSMRTRMSDNAVPLGLIGGGLVWMLASRRRHGGGHGYDYGYDERFERDEAGRGLRESAGELAASGAERAREVAGKVRDRGAELGERAQFEAHRAREAFDTLRVEDPLLLGIAALACGALLGGLMPATRREDRLVGELRDQVVGAATDAGVEKVEQVREAAETKTRELRSRRTEPQPAGAAQHTGI